MEQIIYGVGKSMLIDLYDDSKIIGLANLQDLTVNMSAEEEEIHGGDNPYPIATFPKTRSITVSCQNATFDISMMRALQGGEIVIGEKEMSEYFDFTLTKDSLEYDPVTIAGQEDFKITEGSFRVNGFEKTEKEAVATKGKFAEKTGKITFAKEDIGKTIKGFYTRKTDKNAQTISGYKNVFPTAFKFVHVVDVYNEDSQVCGKVQLVVFKAKSDNNFEMGLKPQTAYAPSLSLKALDSKRADQKLWDYTIELIEPRDGSASNGIMG